MKERERERERKGGEKGEREAHWCACCEIVTLRVGKKGGRYARFLHVTPAMRERWKRAGERRCRNLRPETMLLTPTVNAVQLRLHRLRVLECRTTNNTRKKNEMTLINDGTVPIVVTVFFYLSLSLQVHLFKKI